MTAAKLIKTAREGERETESGRGREVERQLKRIHFIFA